MWRWVVVAMLVAAPVGAQQLVRENTTTTVDLTFTNILGQDELPESVTYRLDDRASRIPLIAPTTIEDPSSAPCPSNAAGCVRVTLPAAAQLMVGQCDERSGDRYREYCTADADCGSGGDCRTGNEDYQDRVLTVSWTYPGGQGEDRILMRLLNHEFTGN